MFYLPRSIPGVKASVCYVAGGVLGREQLGKTPIEGLTLHATYGYTT